MTSKNDSKEETKYQIKKHESSRSSLRRGRTDSQVSK